MIKKWFERYEELKIKLKKRKIILFKYFLIQRFVNHNSYMMDIYRITIVKFRLVMHCQCVFKNIFWKE